MQEHSAPKVDPSASSAARGPGAPSGARPDAPLEISDKPGAAARGAEIFPPHRIRASAQRSLHAEEPHEGRASSAAALTTSGLLSIGITLKLTCGRLSQDAGEARNPKCARRVQRHVRPWK